MNVAYIKKSTLCCTCEWGDVIASWVIAMVCVCKCIVLHIWMSRTWMSHIWMQHIWMLHTRFVNQTIKPLKLWTPNTTAQKTYYVFPFDYHQTAYCERTCTIRDFLNIHTWLCPAQKTYLIMIKRLTCVSCWHVHTHDPCVLRAHMYDSWLFEYTHVTSRTCLASGKKWMRERTRHVRLWPVTNRVCGKTCACVWQDMCVTHTIRNGRHVRLWPLHVTNRVCNAHVLPHTPFVTGHTRRKSDWK